MGCLESRFLQFSAAVYFVIVHQSLGTGSVSPQPQAALVWSLYRVVLAQSLPLYFGGQPEQRVSLGSRLLAQRSTREPARLCAAESTNHGGAATTRRNARI